MENTNLKLDYARPEDVRKINNLLRDSWLATYPNKDYGIAKEDFLPAFEMTPEMEIKQKEFFVQNPPGPGYWVMRNGDDIVGMIRVAKNSNGIGQLKAVYVHPDYFGKGIAQTLMNTALEYLSDCTEIFVQCTAYNDRATKFYQKYGFVLDKNIQTPSFKLSSGKEMPEHTLVRKK